MCWIEGRGDEASVYSCRDELFERAVAGKIQSGEEGGVVEGFVGVGEWEKRQEEELLVLLRGELRKVCICCTVLASCIANVI